MEFNALVNKVCQKMIVKNIKLKYVRELQLYLHSFGLSYRKRLFQNFVDQAFYLRSLFVAVACERAFFPPLQVCILCSLSFGF